MTFAGRRLGKCMIRIKSVFYNISKKQDCRNAKMGIGENGTKQEMEVVMPFLEDSDGRIRKAALNNRVKNP